MELPSVKEVRECGWVIQIKPQTMWTSRGNYDSNPKIRNRNKKKHIIDQQYKKNWWWKDFFDLHGILMYGEWVMIPGALKKRMLKGFHTCHPSIAMMKALLRSKVFWPNIDKEIEENVKSCRGCAITAKIHQWNLSLGQRRTDLGQSCI